MKKFFKIFYSQIFNAFFPILIVSILLKFSYQDYTPSVFLLINFGNVYLLFSDYSANITFIRNALQAGGIAGPNIPDVIIKNIHEYIGIKIIALSVGFIMWILLCLTIPLLHKHTASNILAYTFIIGYNLNFYWIYISSKKEYFFILSNFLSRFWLLLLLVLFEWLHFDFFYLMPFAGAGSIVITIAFFLRFSVVYKIPVFITKEKMLQAAGVIKKEWPLVTNSFLLMSPTTCLSLFIGFVKNTEYIIVYGFAEKIFLGIRALLAVFVNSMYPVICNPDAISYKNIIRIYILFYSLLAGGCMVVYFYSPFILSYFNLSLAVSTVYYHCLLYFILTLIAISINVPLFISLLVHSVINSKKALMLLSIAAVFIVITFALNSIFNNGVTGIVQSLFIAESTIVLTFFILYRNSYSTFIKH